VAPIPPIPPGTHGTAYSGAACSAWSPQIPQPLGAGAQPQDLQRLRASWSRECARCGSYYYRQHCWVSSDQMGGNGDSCFKRVGACAFVWFGGLLIQGFPCAYTHSDPPNIKSIFESQHEYHRYLFFSSSEAISAWSVLNIPILF